jgi:hypothetical protein
MSIAKLMFSLTCGLLLIDSFAQKVPSDEDLLEYDRRIAERHDSKVPTAGYIPDSATAIAIATAVCVPVLGKKLVESEQPLKAGLKNEAWTVIGTFHGKSAGGELIVQLDKKTGTVLYLGHTQ